MCVRPSNKLEWQPILKKHHQISNAATSASPQDPRPESPSPLSQYNFFLRVARPGATSLNAIFREEKQSVYNQNLNAREPRSPYPNVESQIPNSVKGYAPIRRLSCLRNSKFALLAGGFPIISIQQILPINDRIGQEGIETPDTFA